MRILNSFIHYTQNLKLDASWSFVFEMPVFCFFTIFELATALGHAQRRVVVVVVLLLLLLLVLLFILFHHLLLLWLCLQSCF